MTNPVYQAAIEELEQFLPPRVVSRTLKEGLREQNQSPETVSVDDFGAILKGSVYRQLQVSMPPEKAKQTVADILERLTAVGREGASTEPEAAAEPQGGAEAQPQAQAAPPAVERDVLRRQEEELTGLRAALRPFNLYFEWSEVQKLRAQVQLLEEEHAQGREVPALIEEAHRQLAAVRQKLEDHLVIQSRDLAELVEAFEQVQSIGGVKVRRLENLIGHIREAQDSRQLATAELERARKIAKDLRKLVESSVYQERAGMPDGAAPDAAEPAELPPEVTQRLDQLDRDAERHELDRLAHEHSNLIGHLPELSDRLDRLRASLAAGKRIDPELVELRSMFAEATESQRTALQEEFSQIERHARSMPPAVDTTELLQAVTVAQGVLSATLPSIEDTKYIRRLHRLVLEKREEMARYEAEAEAERSAGIGEQRHLIERARDAIRRHGEVATDAALLDALSAAVSALEAADREGRLAPEIAAQVRRSEERLEEHIAEQAGDERVRERAQLRALLARLEGLPTLDALQARIAGVERELLRLIEASDDSGVDHVQVEAVRSLVAALRRDAIDTCRSRLEQLAERASEIDDEDLLGRIQSANNVLDDDVYPDVRQLETALRQSRDAYREDQFGELRRLERDAAEYVDTGLEEAGRLETFLSVARERLESGGVAPDLRKGRELLDQVRETVDRRLADFAPRLDAALGAFHEVAMLNSEDVATVRRILKHLDSQRDAFPRVSTGLRIQLERALEESETLLAKLQEEVDATRAIADSLVSGNMLDDVLGLFGGPTSTAAPKREAVATGDAVADWLGSFMRESGVRAGALVGPAGWVAGGLPQEPDQVRSRISFLVQSLEQLGDQLDQGPIRIATIELEDQILLVAFLEDEHQLVLLLDTPTVLSLVGHRLRTELDDLQKVLRDSEDA